MAIAVSFLAFLSTLAGGLIVLRWRARPHLILGFSAGAVIGVALLDLLPEAIELAGRTRGVPLVTTTAAIGFLLYMALHRLTEHGARGALGAASLSLHSFIDGLSIGLAFKASPAIGAVVAVAVVVHDLCDGINTVTVIRRNAGSDRAARRWLVVDAAAPIVGATAASGVSLGDDQLGLCLALFGGFFLYIGASDLLPASARAGGGLATSAMTILGAAMIYAAVRLAGS